MTWPQVVVLAMCVAGFIFQLVKLVHSDSSSTAVTMTILVLLAYYAFYAWVLRAGGFW